MFFIRERRVPLISVGLYCGIRWYYIYCYMYLHNTYCFFNAVVVVCTSGAGGFPVKCPEKPFSRTSRRGPTVQTLRCRAFLLLLRRRRRRWWMVCRTVVVNYIMYSWYQYIIIQLFFCLIYPKCTTIV